MNIKLVSPKNASRWLLAVLVCVTLSGCNKDDSSPATSKPLVKIKYAISPFQDTLVPIIGGDKFKGWYREEGLDVEFTILGWTEIQEALAGGKVDVAINNESSIVATHHKHPDLVYWYGFNTFDNGFALMIRPDGKLKTLDQLKRDLGEGPKAIEAAAQQLRGKTVVTTGNTDMEQGVAAVARRGGFPFSEITILDLPPDEGLAAFLTGNGDAYIGGIPQRTRAGKEGMLEMISGIDLGPAPINGMVTTKSFDREHRKDLLKLLKVWFKIVNFIQKDPDNGGQMIVTVLNENSGAQFTTNDFKKFWQQYEHYPLTPKDVATDIMSPTGRNSWKARWDDCNEYFFGIKKVIPNPVKPEDAFLMTEVHESYVKEYGDGAP